MKKKFLILGSNSFSAGYLIKRLINNKNYDVICVSRSKKYIKELSPFQDQKINHLIKFYQIDINNNIAKLFNLINHFKPNYVLNYAAQGEVRNSWIYPLDWYHTNVLSTIKLIEFLKNKVFLKKYISISTPEVYGSSQKKISENAQYFPSTPYAISKLTSDLHLQALFKKNNFPVIFTRSSNVYGPYQQLYRIIPRSIINIKLNKKIILHGNGESQRSFIHSSDAADLTLKSCLHGKIGNIYHCSSNENPIKIKKLVNIICKKMNVEFEKSVKLINENFGQDQCYFLNNKKSKKELKWSSKIKLNDGIDSVINWINKDWDVIKNLNHDYNHKK